MYNGGIVTNELPMKNILLIVILLVVLIVGYIWLSSKSAEAPSEDLVTNEEVMTEKTLPKINVISHASFILEWEDLVVYNDPVGDPELYADQRTANIVLVTDIHGDHLDPKALKAVIGEDTALIVPQAVKDELPAELADIAMVMVNGQLIRNEVIQLDIRAIPAYNLDSQGIEIRHEEGRGNGYLLERDGARIYIAGDTADIPEMRALENIDVAFVPMNLPYTMSVEDAAAGVIAFKPKQVYPYHYRTPEGLSDVSLFKMLVNEGAPEVDVVQLDWYAE